MLAVSTLGLSDKSWPSDWLKCSGSSCSQENPQWTGNCLSETDNHYSGGCLYRGRGPIQLTHDYNYQVPLSPLFPFSLLTTEKKKQK
jgi:hypothetical protein